MRIIGGHKKGITIHTPKNLPVRPTTDFAKEGLFNILNNKIIFETCDVLDLFSGTGNISYEFASRGANSVLSVDLNYACTSFIKKTVFELGFNNMKAIKSDVFRFINSCETNFSLIFADAPYAMPEVKDLPKMIIEKGLLREGAMMIIEHDKSINFAGQPLFFENRKYGNVNFSFFIN